MNERDEHLLLFIKDEAEYLLEKAKERNVEDFIDDRDLQHIGNYSLSKILINID